MSIHMQNIKQVKIKKIEHLLKNYCQLGKFFSFLSFLFSQD
ncbi:hypothetical protein ACIN8IBEIGE_130018 [Acinetobacter sp. 8I-beige]|nr:hypothetical protein ACIN8IBEIGE_130018 [Acinetobacter sp. 8I-beige]